MTIENMLPPEDERGTARRLVHELFGALPAEGADFPPHERAAWLIAAAALFDLMYGFDAERPVKVVLAEKKARH